MTQKLTSIRPFPQVFAKSKSILLKSYNFLFRKQNSSVTRQTVFPYDQSGRVRGSHILRGPVMGRGYFSACKKRFSIFFFFVCLRVKSEQKRGKTTTRNRNAATGKQDENVIGRVTLPSPLCLEVSTAKIV